MHQKVHLFRKNDFVGSLFWVGRKWEGGESKLPNPPLPLLLFQCKSGKQAERFIPTLPLRIWYLQLKTATEGDNDSGNDI